MTRRHVTLLVLVGLAFPAQAFADSGQSATVSAQPSQAGRGSVLTLSASGSAGALGQAAPQGVTIALFRGFTIDPGAVTGRCSDPRACPESSRAARGTFNGHTSFLGVNQSFSGTIDGFLAAPTNGALADVIVRVISGGTTYTGRGQLVSVNDRAYGYELRFDPLPQPPLPPGATGSIDTLTLTTGASSTAAGGGTGRRAKRKKARACSRRARCRRRSRRRHRHRGAPATTRSLLTNPSTCATGSWPLELRVRYTDHTDVRALSVACTP
ncbi:MAG: hypothetical protein NVSMB25_19160 [Thermoleophilaceae bacterium]